MHRCAAVAEPDIKLCNCCYACSIECCDPSESVLMENGEEVHRLGSFTYGDGLWAHIVEDDGCFVLVIPTGSGRHRWTTHWFPEALQAVRSLLPLTEGRDE